MGGCSFWWYLKTGLEQVQDGKCVKISASGEEFSGSFCRKRSVLVQGLFAGELSTQRSSHKHLLRCRYRTSPVTGLVQQLCGVCACKTLGSRRTRDFIRVG